MKRLFFTTILLNAVLLLTSFAQDNAKAGLPEGAIARLGKGGINIMRFSHDGTRLAVGTDIGVWLYDVPDGKETVLFTGHPGQVNTLAFSTDGKILASGGDVNTSIQLWDTETGTKFLSIKLSDRFSRVSALMFSQDNKTLTSLDRNRYITEWDVTTGQKLSNKSTSFSRRELAFSQDGETIASGHQENGNIQLWDTGSGREGSVFKAKAYNGVQALAFSPDSKTIASAHDDNTVRLWDTATRTERVTLGRHTEKINALAFSPDSTTLASGGADNTILLWDVHKGAQLAILKGHKHSISTLVFSLTEKNMLASGSSDGTIRFWDTGTQKETSIFAIGHTASIKTVAFSADSSMLVSAANNGQVQIWDVKTGQQLPSPQITHYDTTIASTFSRDATLFASHGADTLIESDGTSIIPHQKTWLWTLPIGDERLTLTEKVNALAISPDNKILATSNTDLTRLWDIKTGTELFQLDAQQFFTDVVVAFSPDGTTLATGGEHGTVQLWNVNTGDKLAELNNVVFGPIGTPKFLAFSPDGSILAVKDAVYTYLWDMKTRKKRNIALTDEIKLIDLFTFSPDGKILLTTNWRYELGSQIHLWDITTERKLLMLTGHFDRIETLVFSPDGRTLASGSQDGTVLLWDWNKIAAKAVTDNIGKNSTPPAKPIKYATQAEEAQAVINWLKKQDYQIQKGDKGYTITQSKNRTMILSSGGGLISTDDVDFTLDRTGILRIRVKGIGTAFFSFDEKGNLKQKNFNIENQQSQTGD